MRQSTVNVNEQFIETHTKMKRKDSLIEMIERMKVSKLHSIYQEEGDKIICSPSQVSEETQLFRVYDLSTMAYWLANINEVVTLIQA